MRPLLFTFVLLIPAIVQAESAPNPCVAENEAVRIARLGRNPNDVATADYVATLKAAQACNERWSAQRIAEIDTRSKAQVATVSAALCHAQKSRTFGKKSVVRQKKRDMEIGSRDRQAWAEIRAILDNADDVEERANDWLKARKLKSVRCDDIVEAIALCLPEDQRPPCDIAMIDDAQRWLKREAILSE